VILVRTRTLHHIQDWIGYIRIRALQTVGSDDPKVALGRLSYVLIYVSLVLTIIEPLAMSMFKDSRSRSVTIQGNFDSHLSSAH
jgi:hypothetical protein